jgi:predicted permease
MALAVVLLVGSGLMIRSFQALREVEPGFTEPHDVQTFALAIPPIEVADPERVVRLQQEMLGAIAAIPGVRSAAFTSRLPMDTSGRTSSPWVPEGRVDDGRTPPSRQMRTISPDLFHTIGAALVAGRDFTWTDVFDGRNVVIVSANLAREWWGSAELAIGKRIRNNGNGGPWQEVVGVIGDVHDEGADRSPIDTIFLPARVAVRRVSFVVRSERAGTEGLVNELRDAVASINVNLPLAQVRTLGEVYDESMSRTSFTLVMLGIAGATALLLGISGLYGVIAYAVSQRRREIGIRMALGAQPRAIQALFLRRGLVLAGVGGGVGIGCAIASTQFLQSLLFGIRPLDPVTFAVTPIVLIAAAVLATCLPARRALAVDPVETMRSE